MRAERFYNVMRACIVVINVIYTFTSPLPNRHYFLLWADSFLSFFFFTSLRRLDNDNQIVFRFDVLNRYDPRCASVMPAEKIMRGIIPLPRLVSSFLFFFLSFLFFFFLVFLVVVCCFIKQFRY